jgi:hypothetical protein
VVAVIVADLRRQFETDADGAEPFDAALPRRFVELVRQTPALLSAQLEMMERVIQVAAEAMAARAAVDPGDPEPQIAAHALAGLWQVQLQAMHRYADGTRSGAEVRDAVIADVRRAARLIDTGLWSFGLAVQGSSSGEAVRLAAEAANDARRQVAAALRQARTAWRQVVTEAHPPHGGRHGPPPGGHRNR